MKQRIPGIDAVDPAAELAKVKAPVLIVQGDNDLQVKVEDARLLAAAQPRAQLLIVKGMNHMLKIADKNFITDEKDNDE